MQLEDIIKQDSDRLFILDPECFIIFTGDSLQDNQPFLRIGNWIDMPVKGIPLIENIIIPDLIIGNPAYEQFNIDIKTLSTNRYIGSKLIIKRYLDFQKLFELNLENVSIVDIDRDLPYLSKEMIISDRDSFIGIFYTDGNFKVVRRGNNIFDLKEIEEKSLTDIKIHNLISLQNRDTKRYTTSGIVLINNNPFFYKNRYFTSYLFPSNYYNEFSSLNIDPAKIREILVPTSNLINITKFIKWKNSRRDSIKIFSDFKDKVDLLQKLFSDAAIIRKSFHALYFDTGDGLNTKNYPGTINLSITYKRVKPSFEDVTVAYIKGYSGIPEILNETLDAIFIPYTIYEEINMLFKAIETPFAIIYDGNRNISKLKGAGYVILYSNIQYEFQNYRNIDNLLQKAMSLISNRDALSSIIERDIRSILNIVLHDSKSEEKLSHYRIKDIFNIISILRIYRDSVTDREFSSMAGKGLGKLEPLIEREIFFAEAGCNFKVILAFCNNSIYEFLEEVDEYKLDDKTFVNKIGEDVIEQLQYNDADLREYYERIINDRKRFIELINLYIENASSKPKRRDKDFSWLDNAFEERKRQLVSDNIEIDNEELKRTIFKMRLKRISRVFIVLIFTFMIFFLSYKSFNYYETYQETKRIEMETKRIERERKWREELIKKYRIHVSDKDIYLYANSVALKNGYERLNFKTLKKKNPNWIYPGNVFVLLDGERVVVKKGDTLWGISDEKIMQISIEFYKTIDK